MKYRGLFHLHLPVIPFFDSKNRQLEKSIRDYLRFLKTNRITIIDFTWHSKLYCRNIKFPADEVSLMKGNLHPLAIFRLLDREAKKEGIIVIPSLEVSAMIDPGRTADILIMHEDEKMVFNNTMLEARTPTLEFTLKNMPNGSAAIIAHPWRFGTGLAFHLGLDKTNEIIKKHKLLVEDNAWVYPWFYTLDSSLRLFPLLSNSRKFMDFHELARKNKEKDGFHPRFFGTDCHAQHLLPGDAGVVEFDLPVKPTKKIALSLIKKGKGTPLIPDEKGLMDNAWWLMRELHIVVSRESILDIYLDRKTKHQ